jgi:hypothetical protein
LRIPYDAPGFLLGDFIELAADVSAAILQTVSQGWERAIASADFDLDSGEVALTERLRDGMREALKSLPWSQMFAVLAGMESRSSKAVLIPDGRTDIPIFVIGIFLRRDVHDPHAIVECKRIEGSDTHLCREYVVEGIDRFRTGKYGANHAVGFMVGYLLSGTADESVSGINTYLTRCARESERLQLMEFAAKAFCWASEHSRAAGSSPIALRHTFLGPQKGTA